MRKKKISAYLGPTNTGKTFAAIQKLYNYNSGVIGFPLRLLARENFEKARKIFKDNLVALITGEEKIIPENAKYFFCTVESIPENLNFEFVAIDEVQMASDYDRGYIFTEKILNMHGTKETLYLGSQSMEKILREIYPNIIINNKPRLSRLSFIGYKNITRLPKRSAIIAFSQIDVYEIANKIKQSHGGVSVVLGALSPDVRNAQVKLFEERKVDYIVATDAIGMGLNLDIKNIFFSGLKKFDGLNERFLRLDEISQIAGRAGRFSNDGFFGTTCNLKKLDNNIINFVENYEYTEITKIFWRNKKLSFTSPEDLLKSLSKYPQENYFKLKKNGNDHRYLRIFLEDKVVKKNVSKFYNLKKLWEVCSIPDYSKNLDEYHTRFLKKVFTYLISEKNNIPDEWVYINLKDIKKYSSKISELNYKISQVRIWSFISFKRNWIESENKFQNKVKELEFNLSKKLHEELISQFIGEFKSIEFTEHTQLIQKKNIVRLEKRTIYFGQQKIGFIDGFNFKINSTFKYSKNIFNNKILEENLNFISSQIKNNFIKAKFKGFDFTVDGSITWENQIVGKFIKGKEVYNPKIKILVDKYFIKFQEEIKKKLKDYLIYRMKKDLPFINEIKEWNTKTNASRAINFSLIENLGHCKKKLISSFFNQLQTKELNEYKALGFRVGIIFFYNKFKGNNFFKQMLINIYFKDLLDNFIEEKIFILNERNKLYSKITFFERLGFYPLKLKKKNFLIEYSYFENLSSRVYFFKKKKSVFNPNNEFEKIFYNNPKKII